MKCFIGKDARSFDHYSRDKFISTAIDHNVAAYFYLTAMSILYGEEKDTPLVAQYLCYSGSTITLEYKTDENNQFRAYFVIEKEGMTIPFRFDATGTDTHLGKLPVEMLDNEKTLQSPTDPTRNGYGYQGYGAR